MPRAYRVSELLQYNSHPHPCNDEIHHNQNIEGHKVNYRFGIKRHHFPSYQHLLILMSDFSDLNKTLIQQRLLHLVVCEQNQPNIFFLSPHPRHMSVGSCQSLFLAWSAMSKLRCRVFLPIHSIISHNHNYARTRHSYYISFATVSWIIKENNL